MPNSIAPFDPPARSVMGQGPALLSREANGGYASGSGPSCIVRNSAAVGSEPTSAEALVKRRGCAVSGHLYDRLGEAQT